MQTDLLLAMPGGSEWIIILSVIFLFFGYLFFWVKTLFDIASSTHKDQAIKVAWFLVVFFLNLPGLLMYFAFGRSGRNH